MDKLDDTVDYVSLLDHSKETNVYKIKAFRKCCGSYINQIFNDLPKVSQVTVSVSKNPPIGGNVEEVCVEKSRKVFL